MKVTVIVPTYNEAENIPELVRRIRASLDGVRILVMDDSPDDETAVAAWKAGCAVVKRLRNRGLSRAVIEGIENEKDAEFVVVMDADLQHPPEMLPKVIEELKRSDFVIPSRYIKDGGCREWGLKRKVISRTSNLLAAPLCWFKVHDLSSGFFAFERSKVDIKRLQGKGFKIMLELLVKGNWRKVTEIPYVFEPRLKGESKLDSSKVVAYLRQLANLYMYKVMHTSILNFMLVGGIGFVINMLTYWGLTTLFESKVTFLGQQFYLPPFLISSLLAIISNYELNRIWTFREWQIQSFSRLRYFIMAGATLLVDMCLLALMVEYANIQPMLAATIAILVVFVLRYTVAKNWIWNKVEARS